MNIGSASWNKKNMGEKTQFSPCLFQINLYRIHSLLSQAMVLCRTCKILELLRGSELSLKFLLRSVAVLSSKKDKQDKHSQAMVQYFLLNAFLVVRSNPFQFYWFSAWQGGSLGYAGCNRAQQPPPASLVLWAHLEQMAQQHLHYTSALLCYPRVATINALPVYLCTATCCCCGYNFRQSCALAGIPTPPYKNAVGPVELPVQQGSSQTAGQGRITISSLLTELVRLQEV